MVSTQLLLNPLAGMGRDGHLTARERKSKRLRLLQLSILCLLFLNSNMTEKDRLFVVHCTLSAMAVVQNNCTYRNEKIVHFESTDYPL